MQSISGQGAKQFLEFVDFPLQKVDYMYREQGGPVAHLVFELWECTRDFLQQEYTTYRSDQTRLKKLKTDYHSKALPIFKRLNTFKRFIDELAYEWCKKRDRQGLQDLFRKMFSRYQSKSYIDSLSAQEFHRALLDLRLFLWDAAQNAPYARNRCFSDLDEAGRQAFGYFINTPYEQMV